MSMTVTMTMNMTTMAMVVVVVMVNNISPHDTTNDVHDHDHVLHHVHGLRQALQHSVKVHMLLAWVELCLQLLDLLCAVGLINKRSDSDQYDFSDQFQVKLMVERGQLAFALLYVVLTVCLSISALVFGLTMTRVF